MKYFSFKYTRQFLTIMMLTISASMMGQTPRKAAVLSITGSPTPVDADHAVKNLVDHKKSTSWRTQGDGTYQELEYLQLKNPDNTDDGKRSWIEIPYAPNENTEIELKFQNTSQDVSKGWRSYYIFSSGAPTYIDQTGMSFAVGNKGYVFRTCNVTSDENVALGTDYFDTNEHTLVCKSSGAYIDGGTVYETGSYTYNNGTHHLTFFSSPYDMQQWARSYNGKIFYVKIRENGTLKYNLVPAKNSEGRCGFYDLISQTFYAFFEMVNYVENNIGDDADKNHLHVKIPYSLEAMPAADSGKKWSNNMINNGYLLKDDITSFTQGSKKVTISKQTIDGARAIKIVCPAKTGGDEWDSQFFITLNEALQEGDKYYISFKYKADAEASIPTQAHNTPGYYNDWHMLGNVNFQTSWQTGTWTGTVSADQAIHGGLLSIAFNMNVLEAANNYYITNVVIKKQVDESTAVPYEAPEGTEIVIKYQNTNPNNDSFSKRYLFNLGTYEEGVMAMSTLYKIYGYTSGEKFLNTTLGTTLNTDLTGKFRAMECELEDNTYTINETPTWHEINTFYLFGTHSTANEASARSFWGKIYSAIIQENGDVKVNLQPARAQNGEWGFYDKVSKVFYGKEEGCGGSEEFTGEDTDNYTGVPIVGYLNSFTVTINKKSSEVPIKFILATTNDNDVSTNPASWTLYGSNDGTSWTTLHTYEYNGSLAPKFSAMKTDGTVQYLYNVETGYFLTDGGQWGTGASLNNGTLRKIVVEKNGSSYKIKNCGKDDNINSNGQYLFYDGFSGVYTDYTNSGSNIWNISSIGDNKYELSISSYGKFGSLTEDLSDEHKTLTVVSPTYNTTWAFVSQEDYDDYISKQNLIQDGKTYIYDINNEKATYSSYRFVVDRSISGNILDIAELAIVTSAKVKHYEGCVYDNMGTIPDNLKVGGSSGYTSMWKTSTDDPRIGSDITLQRTHEYEHEVYVLPGGTVDLKPFADFASSSNYLDQYIRWYDYNTDKKSDNLTYDNSEGNVVSIENGDIFCTQTKYGSYTVRTRVGSTAHYTADTNPTSDSDGVIDVIAIEAANKYDPEEVPWDDDTYEIIEPTLQWRHTFVIKDAKKRADEMTNNNSTYISNHKITLMCPANTPFQYPLPCYEYKEKSSSQQPTDYYYKSGNSYLPVYHYKIVTKRDGAVIDSTTVVDEMSNDYAAYSYKDIQNYNRVFYMKKPQVGTYTIQMFALDADMNEVGMQIMEYDLEVLSKKDGLMVSADELASSSFEYTHQRPDSLKTLFGEPTTVVDFDGVKSTDITGSTDNGYYKWPWAWENSSYGFGYDERGDYNMYMVANNSSITPFNHFADGLDRYDRHYYDTNGKEKGYFFYANAASDPSRMATLNIGTDFCPNTKVYVSAWVNEFQGDNRYAETANVIFSFRGVSASGTETVLNSYVSGYVSGGWNTPNGYTSGTFEDDTNPDNRGKWMHIYYTFTTTDNTDYDHYIITLENNCTSSEGADYAIDDIRAYVCKPSVKANQLKPVCNGTPATDLKVYGNFDQLLDAFALTESKGDASNTVNFNYCFLDRAVYEENLEKGYTNSSTIDKTTYPTFASWRENVNKADTEFLAIYEAACEAAVVKGSYGTTADATYGTFSMNTNYTKNTEYNSSATVYTSEMYQKAYYQQVGNIRNIIFPCNAKDTKMKVGTQYIIAMIKANGGTVKFTDFAIEGKCSTISDFEVIFSGEVKVNGVLASELDGTSICANQKPIITINMNGVTKDGIAVKTENAVFDWYFGPVDINPEVTGQGYTVAYHSEKKTYTDADNIEQTIKLSEARDYFRDNYPTANDLSGEPKGTYTAEMKAYLQEMVDAHKLVLYINNGQMSTMQHFGEVLAPDAIKKYYVSAIPINPDAGDKSVVYCVEPIQVCVKISTKTPRMKNGDDSGLIPYPTAMRDVPLRIGLKQLKKTVIESLDSKTAVNFLYMPLREVTPATDNVNSLIQKAEDNYIYLLASTDPAIAAGTSNATTIANSDLKVIGLLLDITADKKTKGNICHLAFLQKFNFREGYEYTIKFNFEENYDGLGDHVNVCPGEVICTIKVVPEYQKWNGAYSRNWNDDRNWSRVSKSDLFWDSKPAKFLEENADYITDGGTNDNALSFAPADFTKVIIPAGTKFTPYMYDMDMPSNLVEVNFTGAPAKTNYIKLSSPDQNFNGNRTKEIGTTTDWVKFDMTSVDRTDGNVACRSWYDHTCDQIHFMSGAEIMDQRYLHYNKAWCDVEVPVGSWQTISSPLVKIVAGDLYLPSANARQDTPLFDDINYDPDDYDRFKPAVYQRSWNKGTAKVYKLGQNDPENVGVNLDWSEVYNDVNVEYGAGAGFAVRVDVSTLPAANRPDKAKFRFPKADTQYTYYNPGNTDGTYKTEDVNSTDIVNGERPGQLSDLSGTFEKTVGDGASTSYFLVGNPLMCYLNMKKFFDGNKDAGGNDLFERKYWVVTDKGQRAAILDENTTGYVGTVENAATLAPGVSFFVKLADGTNTTQTPKFTADMMAYAPGEKNKGTDNPDLAKVVEDSNDPAEVATNETSSNAKSGINAEREQSTEEETCEPVFVPQLHITARSNDGRESIAVLADGTVSTYGTAETLFDSNLRDDVFLYTTQDGQAMTIANIAPGDTLPLIISGLRQETKLHIEGAKDFDMPLYIIDSETGSMEPLQDELSLSCTANGARFYVTSPVDAPEEDMNVRLPRVTAEQNVITIYAPADGEISASRIYNTQGVCMDDAEAISSSYSVTLQSGIYVIELVADGKTYTFKILL